ncbi:ester cyclase [uncultured Bacteroides sp.]|uniref:ester cyclase n=1 Tax=uncultured Bacteroides sp. TaxID=162156 RepID=UPI002AA72343|nr:ester cyclase [uncultured Bacteroides sp.]
MKKLIYLVLSAILSFTTIVSAEAQNVKKSTTPSQKEINKLRAEIKNLTANNAVITKNLVTFDTLDYTVFSNQQWVRLHESHAKNIKVNWPDGHFTIGIERHIADLSAMFVYAPNTQIKEHPIRFGSGNMTCVTGVMTGTFTKPMPIGDGKFIQPTGKSFKLPMCTVGIWKDGVMIEEYLFWDNQTYMNQLGLGK